MPKPELVHVVNGELSAYVTATSLPVWESIGWTLAETGDSGPGEESGPDVEAEEPMTSTRGDV